MINLSWETALVLLALLLAALVQGVTGFGFGMVSMALLPFIIDPREASVLVGMLSFLTTLFVLVSVRRHFIWSDMLLPALGMLAGIPLGVYALTALDGDVIGRLVGVAILIACAQMTLPQRRPEGSLPWPVGLLAGFIGGILGGAFGIGGPPVIAYASMQQWAGHRYKAMLCSYFALSNLYRVVILLASGLVTRSVAGYALWSAPAVIVGVWLGVRAFNRMSQLTFRKVIIVTLAILGASMLVL